MRFDQNEERKMGYDPIFLIWVIYASISELPVKR